MFFKPAQFMATSSMEKLTLPQFLPKQLTEMGLPTLLVRLQLVYAFQSEFKI